MSKPILIVSQSLLTDIESLKTLADCAIVAESPEGARARIGDLSQGFQAILIGEDCLVNLAAWLELCHEYRPGVPVLGVSARECETVFFE